MGTRWLSIAVCVLTWLAPLPAVAAGSESAPVPAPRATVPDPSRVMIARYAFNGRVSAVVDSSGHGHTLRVISGHGGSVRRVVHGSGWAVAFPPRCKQRVCPHVALQAPTTADLNPGTRDFAYGADVLLPPGQTSTGQNIVQKGYSATSSQWKLQIDGSAGRPSCVLVGDGRRQIRIATSAVSAADGRWHAVRGRRVGTVLAVYVDDVRRGRTTLPAGLSVRNSRPLSIGGKGAFADNDQFNGALDNVWVRIG